MALEFHLLAWAEQDVEQARTTYDQVQYGLGLRFANAVERAIEYASENPSAGRLYHFEAVERPLRQYRVAKFPYDVVTTIYDEKLVVIALRAHRRRPGYWLKALEQL